MDNQEKMERETAEIVLPISKTKVKYFTYLKAKEILGISKAEDGNKYLYETLVVSVNDDPANVYERITDLRYSEYKAVDDLFVKMLKDEGGENEEKKTSLTPTTTTSAAKEVCQDKQ